MKVSASARQRSKIECLFRILGASLFQDFAVNGLFLANRQFRPNQPDGYDQIFRAAERRGGWHCFPLRDAASMRPALGATWAYAQGWIRKGGKCVFSPSLPRPFRRRRQVSPSSASYFEANIHKINSIGGIGHDVKWVEEKARPLPLAEGLGRTLPPIPLSVTIHPCLCSFVVPPPLHRSRHGALRPRRRISPGHHAAEARIISILSKTNTHQITLRAANLLTCKGANFYSI